MNKENQRVKLTRQLLQNSLIELMQEKPIAKTTIKEICENADINRSTFYLYYADQYALLNEIEADVMAHMKEHMEKIGADPGTIQYLRDLLTYVKEHTGLFRTLLNPQGSPSFQNVFVEATMQYLQGRIILSSAPNVTEYTYNFLVMGCISVSVKWLEAGCDVPCQEMAELIFHLSNRAASPYVTVPDTKPAP